MNILTRSKPLILISLLGIFLVGCDTRSDIEANKAAIKSFIALCKGDIKTRLELGNINKSLGFECLVDQEKAKEQKL